ncbi:hypothetical protein [Actinokineospora cianjurensis]|uniref:Uncharacterized protein n=1 Tax=Actinokineospora cianjurensis TaxID=585224 RepID=A0A421AVS3_9PSEU|nr:hypothetical protein [Actinokineospora cianjurensis]RLK54179.1 hypothetical protein CLV68_6182 [Actinokineospora cianjurensis]
MKEHKDWRFTEQGIAVLYPVVAVVPVCQWLGVELPPWVRVVLGIVSVVFGLGVLAYLLVDRGYLAVVRRGRGVAGIAAPGVGVVAGVAFLVLTACAFVEDDLTEGRPLPEGVEVVRGAAVMTFFALLPVYVVLRVIGGRGQPDESVE